MKGTLIILGLIVVQVLLVVVPIKMLDFLNKRKTARCECRKREYTLYAWGRATSHEFREPYLGRVHSQTKCYSIPEEGGTADYRNRS